MSDAHDPVWKRALGCFAVLLLFPLFIVVLPILNLLGLNKLNAKPDYVIGYLEKFIAGEEGDWDWDDFSSIPLSDPKLEDIRQRACDFGPWAVCGHDAAVAAFKQLLEEARSLETGRM